MRGLYILRANVRLRSSFSLHIVCIHAERFYVIGTLSYDIKKPLTVCQRFHNYYVVIDAVQRIVRTLFIRLFSEMYFYII